MPREHSHQTRCREVINRDDRPLFLSLKLDILFEFEDELVAVSLIHGVLCKYTATRNNAENVLFPAGRIVEMPRRPRWAE